MAMAKLHRDAGSHKVSMGARRPMNSGDFISTFLFGMMPGELQGNTKTNANESLRGAQSAATRPSSTQKTSTRSGCTEGAAIRARGGHLALMLARGDAWIWSRTGQEIGR